MAASSVDINMVAYQSGYRIFWPQHKIFMHAFTWVMSFTSHFLLFHAQHMRPHISYSSMHSTWGGCTQWTYINTKL
jgi:hypothetical protein